MTPFPTIPSRPVRGCPDSEKQWEEFMLGLEEHCNEVVRECNKVFSAEFEG